MGNIACNKINTDWNLFGIFLTISTVHTVCVLHKPCDDVDSFQLGDHFISFEAKN